MVMLPVAAAAPPDKVNQYRSRISGPLLDRIDMHIEVPAVPREVLLDQTTHGGESSMAVRERVEAARERQRQRNGSINAALNNKQIEEACRLDMAVKHLNQRVWPPGNIVLASPETAITFTTGISSGDEEEGQVFDKGRELDRNGFMEHGAEVMGVPETLNTKTSLRLPLTLM